jgi:hypothetical protein
VSLPQRCRAAKKCGLRSPLREPPARRERATSAYSWRCCRMRGSASRTRPRRRRRQVVKATVCKRVGRPRRFNGLRRTPRKIAAFAAPQTDRRVSRAPQSSHFGVPMAHRMAHGWAGCVGPAVLPASAASRLRRRPTGWWSSWATRRSGRWSPGRCSRGWVKRWCPREDLPSLPGPSEASWRRRLDPARAEARDKPPSPLARRSRTLSGLGRHGPTIRRPPPPGNRPGRSRGQIREIGRRWFIPPGESTGERLGCGRGSTLAGWLGRLVPARGRAGTEETAQAPNRDSSRRSSSSRQPLPADGLTTSGPRGKRAH